MKSYIIHLVRHGMTEANFEGRYVGSTDVPLAQKGLQQLQELRERYDYEQPELFYSSPMTRCLQTVEALYGEVEVFTVEQLREYSMGDFEGKTVEQLKPLPEYAAWLSAGTAPPNGESSREFATRVCVGFTGVVQDILKRGKTNAVICAHGGVIMTLLATYGIPQREMTEWGANNGRGYTLRVTPSIWMRTGMVEVLSEYPFGSADEPDYGKLDLTDSRVLPDVPSDEQ